MELKGTYKLTYTVDKKIKDLVLIIQLKQIEGIPKKYQNIWEGMATLDGQLYIKEDVSHCVNAKLAAERIGKLLKIKIKTDAQKEGKSFRVKKEEIK